VPGVEFAKPSVSLLRVSDRGRFVKFAGTVIRTGAVKVVQEWREFQCENCGHRFSLRASPESGYDFEVPQQCRSGEKKSSWDPKAKRPKTMRCASKLFRQLPHGEEAMSDFQEVRVQDPMQALGAGVIPQSVCVSLFGDLVGQVQPGDSVSVEGVVWQRWRAPWVGKRLELELFVEASHIEVVDNSAKSKRQRTGSVSSGPDQFIEFWTRYRNDKWQGRAALIRSTAPWLSGVPVPKLALLLTLIGGAAPAALDYHVLEVRRGAVRRRRHL